MKFYLVFYSKMWTIIIYFKVFDMEETIILLILNIQ